MTRCLSINIRLGPRRRVTMAIQDRNLSAGPKLCARYRGQVHTAEVVNQEGKLVYWLSDGREFKSPSAAGTAITGKACNGWAVWSTGEATEKAPKPERPAGGKRGVNAVPKPERKPRQRKERDVPRDSNGQVLPIVEQVDGAFECGNCAASFPTQDEAAAHLAEAHLAEAHLAEAHLA
jgi:hypothetical protein